MEPILLVRHTELQSSLGSWWLQSAIGIQKVSFGSAGSSGLGKAQSQTIVSCEF